ncbi:alpha-2,8-sialyltransferase 8F isoform X1 [Sarcophilus harrisii]|uniref:ST8 alpha-N-acetyl-neuraminide alpha-2,8-sialyltransferase 6 n=1 Tax=Sarcophilus harrisii TaxID=9305 RepID=A0A7N4Q2B8_SARHA|nr:alpha-2,8-sialyltransferase 8F isoform X1 [Sarcophilus harrisii]XP_031795768.1 alpha-2,8-sialyltransferase 8F isoform X1 [Sarcophilus harrisii]
MSPPPLKARARRRRCCAGGGGCGLGRARAAGCGRRRRLLRMRAAVALLTVLASLLLCLYLLWLTADGPLSSRDWRGEARKAVNFTPGVPRKLGFPLEPAALATNSSTNLGIKKPLHLPPECKSLQDTLLSSFMKKKRYSEDYYLEIITNVQNCRWQRQPEEYKKFRSKLVSCCDATHNLVISQNNTPLGSNISYEAERASFPIEKGIFRMLPVSQPFVGRPFNQCAVVGNGGILRDSICGAEIDKSDFVFRCNLPPITGNISRDVGNKTNLVTVNPSIIGRKYGELNGNKSAFVNSIATYGEAFLILPAFSFRRNTDISLDVYHTLHGFKAKQKAIFFHPKYLKSLAQFWRTKGVHAFRLSSGLMITSAAIELCENVKLYGFWPFSKTTNDTPINHHYYDNELPKPGFHAMPIEYREILQLHGKGVLKLQFSKCEAA